MLDLYKIEAYLLTKHHVPKLLPYPQVSELMLELWLDFHLFILFMHKYSLPKPSADSP